MLKLAAIALLILVSLHAYVERHRKPPEFKGDYTEARAEAESLWRSLLNCDATRCCRGRRTSKNPVIEQMNVERIDVWGRELNQQDAAAAVEFDGTTAVVVGRSRTCDARGCSAWRPGAAGMNLDLTYFITKRNGRWITRAAGDPTPYFRPATCAP